MHKVLERQLRNVFGSVDLENIPPGWILLLQAVSDTYTHAEEDRTLMTHSLDLSSRDLGEANKRLRSENEVIEQKVTERTQELERERSKLNEIAHRMTTGAILLNEKGDLSFVNTAAIRFLNLTDITNVLEILIQRFSVIPVREHISKGLRGESTEVPEAEALGKIFSISFNAVESDTGTFGVLIWLNNITAQKLLERSKNQFIAIASHEMRTPLAIVRGLVELMMDDDAVKQNDSLNVPLHSILRNTIRLLGIANDFLDVQSLEEHRMSLNRQPLDAVTSLEEAVKDLSRLAEEKKIYVKVEKPVIPPPPLMLDKDRFQQICMNFIANGIHYTDRGGVTVSLESSPSSVKIYFQDTGRGIPPEDQTHLFRKFETGKTFLHSKEYGSGMGLYISSLLATLMDGSVKLEKSEVGVGSVFSVTFHIAPSLTDYPQDRLKGPDIGV